LFDVSEFALDHVEHQYRLCTSSALVSTATRRPAGFWTDSNMRSSERQQQSKSQVKAAPCLGYNRFRGSFVGLLGLGFRHGDESFAEACSRLTGSRGPKADSADNRKRKDRAVAFAFFD